MKKPILYGMGNSGDFNYVIVSKNNDFFKWLDVVLLLGFGISDSSMTYKKDYKISAIKGIRGYLDKHESFSKNDVRIDIFYGEKRVFITFNCSLELRDNFVAVLKNNTFFTKKNNTIPSKKIARKK